MPEPFDSFARVNIVSETTSSDDSDGESGDAWWFPHAKYVDKKCIARAEGTVRLPSRESIP